MLKPERIQKTIKVEQDISVKYYSAEDPVNEFQQNGFVTFKDHFPPNRLKDLSERILNCETTKDDQCPLSESSYGLYDDILEELLDTINYITDKKLYPTYSYARKYKNGEKLDSHTDRPSCEYSITLCLDQGKGTWPIFFKNKDETYAKISHESGSFTIYKGCEIPHHRDVYEGDGLIQVFLHYVDSEGPNKNLKYDGRTKLSHHKSEQYDEIMYWYYDNAFSNHLCNSLIDEYNDSIELMSNGAIGLGIADTDLNIRNVNKLNLPSDNVIASSLIGYGLNANNSAWKFDITHSIQSEYLRYEKNGHYVAHIDSNFLINNENSRKLTVLVFLNEDFEGGKLFLNIGNDKIYPPQAAGTVLVFPSFITHGVEPVLKGIRHTVVNWLLGPNFR